MDGSNKMFSELDFAGCTTHKPAIWLIFMEIILLKTERWLVVIAQNSTKYEKYIHNQY